MDADQMASSEASLSGSTVFSEVQHNKGSK